jgi:hypothetical protein
VASSAPASYDGTFSNSTSLDFWNVSPGWQTVGTVSKSFAVGTMVISPVWADAKKDGFNIETLFDNSKDFIGATVSVDVYMPEAYITDGNLAIQIYLKDADGTMANGGWTAAGWGPWRWSGSEESTTNTDTAHGNRYGWATLTFTFGAKGLKGSDGTYSWGWKSSDGDGVMDVSKITTFGIDIESAGKPINVIGDIKIDNVVLRFTITNRL